MSNIGYQFIENQSEIRRQPCICGQESCAKLSLCFESVGDARACKLILPTLTGSRGIEMKRHKLNRIVHHLGLGLNNVEQYASVDKRNRSVKSPTPTKRKTRSPKKSPAQREYKVIAAHHFHPEVVHIFIEGGKMTFLDCISERFIKESGLWMNGYTDIDIYAKKVKLDGKNPERVFAPCPSYKYAADDYKFLATRHEINNIIKRCTDASYGHTFLRRRGEEDVMEPVEKMARLSVDDPNDLQRAVCVLAEKVEHIKAKEVALEQALEVEKNKNNNAAIEDYVQGRKHGLDRLNISSDKYHKANPKVAKVYFKFEDTEKGSKLSSWDVTKQFLKDMFGVEHQEPTIDMIYDKTGRAKKLTEFETCLVALIFFQKAYDHEFIASIFGCTRQLVERCIKYWAPHFREVGYHMARLPLTKEFLDKTYPQTYIDLAFSSPVANVVDGTDVLMETVRVCRAVNIMQASNKLHASGCRGITWSTPIGMIHEFTDPFFARPSEKAIVRLWTGHGRFLDMPVGYLNSADKGFDGTSGFYPHYNPVIHPAFLTGGNGAQFTEEQIDWNRKACEMRYTSEVVFSRFKRYGGLGGIVPRQHFPYLRDLWAWAHGMANYYNCLQVPANNDYFPESKYSKKK